MDNLSNFSERLSELMFDDENKNATELSLLLNCESSTISHYLNGTHLPTVEMAIKLADYFNVTTDFLLGLDSENKSVSFKDCPPFAERFVEVCKICKVSRYKLKQLTGISESVMRYWVRGKTKPTVNNIVKIATALNCSVDFVLGREN